MKNNILNLIHKLPKSDLHVHLDGSVRVDTLIDLSKKQEFALPSYTITGLNELVFKDQYQSLVEYLKGFSLVLPIMQTPENLERISYEFAQDNINENVYYVEVKFAPQLHINDAQNIDQVLLSINRGLNKAKLEHNKKPEVKTKKIPMFNYGIIVCAMRYFSKGYSQYFDLLLKTHKNSNLNIVTSIASYELAKDCVRIRDKYDIPIVAFDLAGAEAGNPPIYHKDAYHFAHKNLMHLIVHAGEVYRPESIFQAITELYPERIAHGFYLFSKNEITDRTIKNKKEYIEKMTQYIAHQRTTIEVCLTSNLQTIPSLKNIKNHPFSKMIKSNLNTVICTDNRTISKTNVTKEILIAIKNFDLNQETIKNIMLNGFKKSFYPGTYTEKLNYVAQILTHYDAM